MIQNDFAEWLVKVMLSWSRWLSNILWSAVNSAGSENPVLSWFGRSWIPIVAVLVIGGILIDWLVWMLRWRPYWLWFRKKQVLYEELPARDAEETPSAQRPAPHFEGRAHKKPEAFADPFDEEDLWADEPAPREDAFADPITFERESARQRAYARTAEANAFADPVPDDIEEAPRKRPAKRAYTRPAEENAFADPIPESDEEAPRKRPTKRAHTRPAEANAFADPIPESDEETPRKRPAKRAHTRPAEANAFADPVSERDEEAPRKRPARREDEFSDPGAPEANASERYRRADDAPEGFDDPFADAASPFERPQFQPKARKRALFEEEAGEEPAPKRPKKRAEPKEADSVFALDDDAPAKKGKKKASEDEWF